jgi:hypothetical protein
MASVLDVTRIRNNDSGLSLDGLDHEGARVRVLQMGFQSREVVVGNHVKSVDNKMYSKLCCHIQKTHAFYRIVFHFYILPWKVFLACPIKLLIFFLFFSTNEPELGAGIDLGMALTLTISI